VQRIISGLCVVVMAIGLLAALPVASREASAADAVRIERDGYGVPHIYSDTKEGVSYGAGYAVATDRLFQLEVLRALFKGRATELFGPVPGFAAMDDAARRLFYTDAERRAKATRLSPELQRMYAAFVDGINDRMDEVRADPRLLPKEYTTFGLGQPRAWDVTDSIAIADGLVETFGAGGGSELAQAALLQHLIGTYGEAEGQAAFDDVRWINDPASPVSIPAELDWRSTSALADGLPAKQWRRDARIGLDDEGRRPLGPAATSGAAAIGTLEQIGLVPGEPSAASTQALAEHVAGVEQLREFVSFGSNALIAGPGRTADGGTVQLGGPQVGQFAPQIIMEFGLHSPANDWDMTGLTFAGAGPVVLIGRTGEFAWTTTTGNSDGADIYVEQLAPAAGGGFDTRRYVYEGEIYAMDCRTESFRDKGAPIRSTELCRTRNGPVLSVDADNGVAFSIRRSWFDMETGTLEGFTGANFVSSIEEFGTEISKLQSNHNMFYVDRRGDIGYWHPGAIPLRPEGTDIRLPQDGRFAAAQWSRMRTADEMPHAINFDRGWLANWNNKPAVDWDNGDAANYGAVFRNRLWNEQLAAEPNMSYEKVAELNRINGTSELEFGFFQEQLVRAGRASGDAEVRAAAEVLATWDARREDNTGDGLVDSEPGYSLWKRWRTIARDLAFADDLGPFANRSSDSMLLHVIDGPDASLVKQRDWLGGEPVTDFLNRVMRANLDALADEFGSEDMADWRSAMPTQHYTRLNDRFFDCEVARAASPVAACDDRLPGNVRALDFMNRGTYNHIVEFTPGTRAGLPVLPEVGPSIEQRDGYTVTASSIISPGQSGFIDQAGRQDPHYEDQHELYGSWQYKPMPLREADVAALGDADTVTLTYDPDRVEVVRAAGPDRIATAVDASRRTFASASTAVLATAGTFADALTAGPLAVALEGPLLLVGSDLRSDIAAELDRLGAQEVVIVGGSAAVSEAVVAEVRAAGLEVRRVSGPDRFATAAAIAREVGADDGEAFLASGTSFADALSASPVAAGLGAPILLTGVDALPAATRAALEDLGIETTFVVGGRAVVSEATAQQVPGARRLAGAERYATSAAVARFGIGRGLDGATAHIATGRAFPDGLTAGPIAAAAGGVVLLVDGELPTAADPAFALLAQRSGAWERLVVFGGSAAVAGDVAERARLAVEQR
jgi:penicillin G amidase